MPYILSSRRVLSEIKTSFYVSESGVAEFDTYYNLHDGFRLLRKYSRKAKRAESMWKMKK